VDVEKVRAASENTPAAGLVLVTKGKAARVLTTDLHQNMLVQ